jgi:glycosyltransferase involved in cell wall biosynthesis
VRTRRDSDVHVLFLSVADANDMRVWSGTPFHMYRALRERPGVQVTLASPIATGMLARQMRLAERLANGVRNSAFLSEREPLLLRRLARRIDRIIDRVRPDVVLCPSSVPVAALSARVPLVVWTDATWAAMVDYYPEFSLLSARTRRCGHRAEQAALARVALAVYSNEWAARSACGAYGMPDERVAVVPFGANLMDVPSGDDVRRRLSDLDRSTCTLLLLGRDWHRKGADHAVEATRLLRAAGVDARLHVAGCNPPPDAALPPEVTVQGDLDKADPAGAARIARLLRQASFLVLPSRAECSPIVLAEAQAFGVPVVASRTGGMASMMAEGRSGVLVSPEAFAGEAATEIHRIQSSPPVYDVMAQEAREYYERCVNWRSAMDAVVERMQAIHDSRRHDGSDAWSC